MDIEFIKNVWHDLVQYSIQAKSMLLKGIVGLWLYFTDIHVFVYAVLFLSLVDVVTGVWSAVRTKEPVTSRKLRKGLLEKTGLYLFILASVMVIDVVIESRIGVNNFYLTFIATVMITTYELKSILENAIKINPNLSFLNRIVFLVEKIEQKQIDNAENILGASPSKEEKPAQETKPEEAPEAQKAEE